MSKILISTEDTCDLSKELLEQFNIHSIEMHFMVDGISYSTKQDIDYTKIYKAMEEFKSTNTSQVNEQEYEDHFSKLLKEGDVLHIAFSTGLSGTYHNAVKVAERLNKTSEHKVVVVDSLCASSGQGLLCILTSEKLKEISDINELEKYVIDTRLKINHLFTVDQLKYLERTGRISKAKSFLGKLANIKPILRKDENGCLVQKSNVISRKKALKTMVDEVANEITKPIIFIGHANCMDDALRVKEMLKDKTQIEATILNLSLVISSHSGPGTLAIFYL